MRVVVDGENRAEINLAETQETNFKMENEAELIEICAFSGKEDLILATHLLNFGELEKGINNYDFLLENGQKISFNLKPSFDKYGEVSSVNCLIEFFEKQEIIADFARKERFSLTNYLQNLAWMFKPAMAFGLILLLFGFGWFVFQKLSEDRNNSVENSPKANEIIVPQVLPEEELPKESNSSNLPDNREQNPANESLKAAPKEKQNPKFERKTQPKKEVLVIPKPQELQANKRENNFENGTDKEGILRLPIRETLDFPRRNVTRQGNLQKSSGKSLSEIKTIFIEISGDEIFGQKIADEISAEIGKSGRFSITGKENADAALKIFVRHEADVDVPEEKMVTVVVRLVNEEGFVVYPNRKGISGWKYVGEIGKLPKRIVGDLLK